MSFQNEPSETHLSIGQVLRILREQAGISRQEIEQRMGVMGVLSDLESKPSITLRNRHVQKYLEILTGNLPAETNPENRLAYARKEAEKTGFHFHPEAPWDFNLPGTVPLGIALKRFREGLNIPKEDMERRISATPGSIANVEDLRGFAPRSALEPYIQAYVHLLTENILGKDASYEERLEHIRNAASLSLKGMKAAAAARQIRRNALNSHIVSEGNPSPVEIAQMAAEIREGWSKGEEERRRVKPSGGPPLPQ